MALGRPTKPLKMTPEEKKRLTKIARGRTGKPIVVRARIALGCSCGLSNTEVAKRLHVTEATVCKWRERFRVHRVEGLLDEPRPGAPRTITDVQVEEVIAGTLERMPPNATHWSTRLMAQETGLSQTAIVRIWRDFGLRPHLGKNVEFAKDARFAEKLRSIIERHKHLEPSRPTADVVVREVARVPERTFDSAQRDADPGMVYVVDDEPRVGEAFSSLLAANGKNVRTFTSGQEFLDFRREDSFACLILDLRMPGLGGLEVQQLISARTSIPVIFITGRGDIPSTVRAMKGGATDFLTKPVDETALLASVERALQQDRANRREQIERASLLARYQSLTPREREVLPLLVRGLLNKEVAFELGISEYTVQIHRSHIMRKMEADSFAALVTLAAGFNLEPNGGSNRKT